LRPEDEETPVSEPPKVPDSDLARLRGCLFQMFWSSVGPGLVLIAGAVVLANGSPVGGTADWCLVGAAVASVVGRMLDPSPPAPAGPGEAPPPGRWAYAAWIAGGAAAVFVLAHFVLPGVI
jgi:hypothetical protein